MNLIQEAWIPIRRRDGSRDCIMPEQLSDPDIVAFDADRADFNGALAQFAIGLLQTTTPVDSPVAWKQLNANPPTRAELHKWFAPVIDAFTFDGDGARFMQDCTLTSNDATVCGIGALLIEAPGENAVRNNADFFSKRGTVDGICTHCAAIALLTLQINAPAGGAGNRTGLRGGGPLTTLVVEERQDSLWRDLWLNVVERPVFLAHGGDVKKVAPHFTFPWLEDIQRIQKPEGETSPLHVHPAHAFWAMPRRIRLNFEDTRDGLCDICGEQTERLVREYIAKNKGLNYKGAWNHPLSPYYETKDGWLPLHPQPGGFGYRHWLGWVLGLRDAKRRQRPAAVVNHAIVHRRRQTGAQLRLWTFGYDMDKGKARCWYESTLPLYGIADCDSPARTRIESEAALWLAGADLAALYLRSAVKDAWFKADARGDFSAVDAAFWTLTEPTFYLALKTLVDEVRQPSDLDMICLQQRQSWREALDRAVVRLFDGVFVGAGPIEHQNPQRAALAFRQLSWNIRGAKIKQALGLPVDAPTKSGRGPKTAAAVV